MTRPALLLALLAAPALADDRVVEPGTPLTPDDAAHVFAHTCLVPADELEASAEDLVVSGVMQPMDPISEGEPGMRYSTPDGLAILRVEAHDGGASCEMGVSTDAGDLGPVLEESLASHVATLAPQGAEDEGLTAGRAWLWEEDGTPHRVEMLSVDDGFLLRALSGDAMEG